MSLVPGQNFAAFHKHELLRGDSRCVLRKDSLCICGPRGSCTVGQDRFSGMRLGNIGPFHAQDAAAGGDRALFCGEGFVRGLPL